MSRRRGRAAAIAIVALGLAGACSGEARPRDPKPKETIAWRPVGSWSGHGNKQTESFTGATGALRIRWSATPLNAAKPDEAGTLRVTAHSAISGRLLEQAVDHAGPGSGIAYVNQDPHVFYLLVDSRGLEWSVSVEEGIAGTVTGH